MRARGDRREYLKALCRIVPYHLVEAVLDKPTEHAIADRRYDGVVLSADLVGFTPLCESLAEMGGQGLSRLSDILDLLFRALLEQAIFPYDGYVILFGGDSITAIFHGPEREARAATAALCMRELMRGEVGRELCQLRRQLLLRVGLAAGEVTLPVLGDVNRRSVLCAGEAAHRALHLQQLAPPGEVTLDEALREKLGADATCTPREGGVWCLSELNHRPPPRPVAELDHRVDAQVEEKIALLEPFVPQPLAMRLRSAPGGWRIEGELRDATILFVELSLGPSGAIAPQQALNIARSVPRTLHKYGGLLSKVDLSATGHRAMGLFGLGGVADNDQERALLAAMEISARLKGLAAERAGEIEARIGVHCGQVYFGAIGSDLKHDITAVGDAVNVAARAMAAARAWEVVCTEDIKTAVEGRFQLTPRGPITVKGKARPLTLYSAHGATPGVAHYVHLRQRQRFLAGRAQEIELLQQAVRDAFDGRSRILGIGGDAGTGKSALLAQVIDRWINHGGFGILGRCLYSTRDTPLAPVVAMFYNFLGFSSEDSDAYRRDRLRAMLTEFDLEQNSAELVTLLQPVQRPDGTTEAALDLADLGARNRVIESIATFVCGRLRQGPVLYVLEDLQHADSLTLQLAVRLAALPRDLPFLFLGTYRPDPTLDRLRRALDQELPLAHLNPHQIEEMACHTLEVQRVEPALRGFLWRRTQGNPAHLAEVLQFIADRRLVRSRAGVLVPAGSGLDLLEQAVPLNQAHVALARLDTLGEVERHLLRTASAIGQRFSQKLLEQVSSRHMERDLLSSALSSLETQRVLAQDQRSPGYMFRDDLVRAVAYDTIPVAERQSVHRRVADALERSPEQDAGQIPATLAMHRERAGQLAEAAKWYQRAIHMAATLAVDRETLVLVERWERIVEQLPEEERPAARAAAQIYLIKLVATARSNAAAATVGIARLLALRYREHIAPAELALVDFWLGHALIALAKPESARVRLERAFKGASDPELRFEAACLLGSTYACAQDEAETSLWLRRAAALAPQDPAKQARVQIVQAHFFIFAGAEDRASAILEPLRRAARERGDLTTTAIATSDLARCALAGRLFDAARQGFEEAITFDRAIGDWWREAFDMVHLGQTLLWAGDPVAAQPHLEMGLAISKELGNHALACEAQVHLGAVLARTKDPQEGRELCEDGYRNAVRADLREVEIAADLHLLQIAMLQQDRTAVSEQISRCSAHSFHLAPLLYRHAFEQLQQEAQLMI